MMKSNYRSNKSVNSIHKKVIPITTKRFYKLPIMTSARYHFSWLILIMASKARPSVRSIIVEEHQFSVVLFKVRSCRLLASATVPVIREFRSFAEDRQTRLPMNIKSFLPPSSPSFLDDGGSADQTLLGKSILHGWAIDCSTNCMYAHCYRLLTSKPIPQLT